MTPSTNPVEVEGNIHEIDFENHYFILSGRDHKPFIKVFWKFQHEKDTRILKQKAGYYEAPVVEMEESSGGLKEAWLVGLPYLERPADYPRIPKQGKGGNGGQPHNEKLIAAESLLKSYTELWKVTNTPDMITLAQARAEIKAAVEEDLPWLMALGGSV